MRKLTAILLVMMLVCGASAQAEGGIKIVTTIFPVFDLARSVGGDGAEITMLVKPGVESHAYEPTPQDIMAIAEADVFLCIGGENDAWVERVLGSIDMAGKAVVRLIDSIETPLEVEDEDEDDHGHDHDHGEEGIDEHIWTWPLNARSMADAIEAALSGIDPDRADAYRANAAALGAELARLDADFKSLVEGGARRELVFGDRFPFRYMAEAYGLDCHAAFPSCANNTEPSAKTIAELIELVEADEIPVIYTIEQSNGRVAQVIARATGATIEMLHSCHNVTKDEIDQGATYLSLMRANLDALRAGLY